MRDIKAAKRYKRLVNVVVRKIYEFALDQAIAAKNLEDARDLILVSSEITFNENLAYRLLRVAIDLKHMEYVDDLIMQIPNLNTQEGGELIWQALQLWSPKIVTKLIKAGANVNVRRPDDPKRQTLLHSIARLRNNREDHYKLALLLLDYGADVNAINQRGNTALHYAATPHRHQDKYSFILALELVNRGASIDVVNNSNQSVVDIAMRNPWFDRQLCPLLIALANVDDQVKCRWIVDALTIIIEEPRNDDSKGMLSLLQLGYPVLKMQDLSQAICRIFFMAMVMRKRSQMNVLIEYGWDDDPQLMGYDPAALLQHSFFHNMRDTMNILIRKGVEINVAKNWGRRPIIYAACRGDLDSCYIELVRLLLRLGADINIMDDLTRTPLITINWSFMMDHVRECLIEHYAILKTKGIVINQRDWKYINGRYDIYKYFNRCLNELERMKTIKINYDVTLYRVLTDNVKTVSGFARNSNFVNNYYNNKDKIRRVFPLYYRELDYKIKMAEARKDILCLKEEALMESLLLPLSVAEKIATLASFDELEDFEKRYHLSMVKL